MRAVAHSFQMRTPASWSGFTCVSPRKNQRSSATIDFVCSSRARAVRAVLALLEDEPEQIEVGLHAKTATTLGTEPEARRSSGNWTVLQRTNSARHSAIVTQSEPELLTHPTKVDRVALGADAQVSRHSACSVAAAHFQNTVRLHASRQSESDSAPRMSHDDSIFEQLFSSTQSRSSAGALAQRLKQVSWASAGTIPHTMTLLQSAGHRSSVDASGAPPSRFAPRFA